MKIWSDTEYVYRCLADRPRTLAFKAAIEAVVKASDIVLDVGTGSGIMSILRPGVEPAGCMQWKLASIYLKFHKRFFAESEFADRIVPLRMEARELDLSMMRGRMLSFASKWKDWTDWGASRTSD